MGTERPLIALRSGDGRLLVGPADRALAQLAWERLGGRDQAVDVSRSPHRLEPVSATFHGATFAPVAAHLAAGAELADAPASPLDPADLERVELPQPRMEGDALAGSRARNRPLRQRRALS